MYVSSAMPTDIIKHVFFMNIKLYKQTIYCIVQLSVDYIDPVSSECCQAMLR